MPTDDTPSPTPSVLHDATRAAPVAGAPRPAGVLGDSARLIAGARELEQRVRGLADTLPTAEERAVAIVDSALDALGASAGIAARLVAEGDALELVGAVHVPADLADAFRRVPLDARMPVAEAARTGRACYCESRRQLLDRFPAMREIVERLELHAVAAVPVRHLARVEGAVAFGFPTPRRFTPGEQALLRGLGARYARALHAARRYYAEHDARTAEAAARRTAEEARAVAEAAARAQGDFVAVISHELRTPLQAILGYADLLAAGVGGELAPQHREFVARIAAGGTSLLQIVENLLGFSAAQVGPQRADVEAFDLGRAVSDVVALAEPLAARAGLTLRLELDAPDSPLVVSSDPRKVRQIVTNLVGNALKFTERGEVLVTAGAAGADRVRIAVRDTGVGIAAAELPYLFEPFWRGDRRPRTSEGGTGLGLSIVRQLARVLGGDVTVASEVGRGSTFTVELPVTLAAGAHPTAPEG